MAGDLNRLERIGYHNLSQGGSGALTRRSGGMLVSQYGAKPFLDMERTARRVICAERSRHGDLNPGCHLTCLFEGNGGSVTHFPN
jgi:hypothetical protein